MNDTSKVTVKVKPKILDSGIRAAIIRNGRSMLNYEVLANMYKSRKNHRLDEWHTLCDWIETLPYSELITSDCVGRNRGGIK